MFRRKALLTLAGVLGIAGAFVATEAMAAFNACSNFTVTLQGGSCVAVGGGKEVCTWDVSGGALGLNKISHLEFSPLSLLQAAVVAGDDGISVQPPGNGGTGNTEYAAQIPAVDVVTVTAQVLQGIDPIRFEVTGSGGNIGLIGVHSKAGRKEEVCTAEGPILPPPIASFTSTLASCVNIRSETDEFGPLEASVSVTRGPDSCIASMIAHNVPDCADAGTEVVSEDPADGFIFASIIGGQICQETVEANSGSPFYGYRFTSGGQLYKLCYDLQLPTGPAILLSQAQNFRCGF